MSPPTEGMIFWILRQVGFVFTGKPTPDWSSGEAVPNAKGSWNGAKAQLRKAGWTKRAGPIINLNSMFLSCLHLCKDR